MATTLDLRPATVHLKLQAGDDETFTFTFDTTLAGYTDWSAVLTPRKQDPVTLDVDDSDQASNVISITITAVQTAAMASTGTWQFQVVDPNGRLQTLMGGNVTVSEDFNP